MTGLPIAFVTSLLLGMRHATDADHIVAVSTIASGERSALRAGWIGVMWGLGHTLTIAAVGGGIVLFKWSLSARLGLSLELAVAAMLVVLGVLNLRPHVHAPSARMRLKPFGIGVVHGLAGSAGTTLLVVPLIDDARWAFIWLVVFGLGTIVGMALVTVVIAAPAAHASRVAGLQRSLRVVSGALSLAFGVLLGYEVGFVRGLFSPDVHGLP